MSIIAQPAVYFAGGGLPETYRSKTSSPGGILWVMSIFIVLPSQCLTSGSLRRWPYIVSSTISTQRNSVNWAFFSRRRYSGMLIFHGLVKTCGSVIVASYWIASLVMGVKRSV